MNHDSDLHDDKFMEQAAKTQRKMAVVGFFISLFFFLLVVLTVYFFLAAAGVVPQMDLIPFIPYV